MGILDSAIGGIIMRLVERWRITAAPYQGFTASCPGSPILAGDSKTVVWPGWGQVSLVNAEKGNVRSTINFVQDSHGKGSVNHGIPSAPIFLKDGVTLSGSHIFRHALHRHGTKTTHGESQDMWRNLWRSNASCGWENAGS